jgi:predicted nucleotidyltransferase
MFLKDQITDQKDFFSSLCQKHKVKYLYAFGSSITEKFDYKKSDIDLIVEVDELDPLKRGDYLISLWDNFEIFFHRKVDLLTESSIRNPYLKSAIDLTKTLIYDGTRSEILI